MDPFEVFAQWDSWRTSPNLTLTMTLKRMNRDQTDDFIFNSTKVMRGNATNSWKLAAILDFGGHFDFYYLTA